MRFQISGGTVSRYQTPPNSSANFVLLVAKLSISSINWNLKNGTITSNPWAGVKQYKVQARERFLRPDEIKLLGKFGPAVASLE